MAWADILGQEFAMRALQAHLAAGRVFSAYLFVGPDGVGKRRLAIEMAKALNCPDGRAEGCGQCRTCRQIERSVHPDVHRIIPGGASEQIRIDEIRQLIGRVNLKPFSANVQVAIIDGAERLTEEAANSLLKALEEPSARTRFLLTTARLTDCLPTVVSRCQHIRCQPLPVDTVRRILIDTQGCDPQAAETIARLSGGSASQAIDLKGRWAPYGQWLARFSEGTLSPWIELSLPDTRQEVAHLLDVMLGWLRDMAVAGVGEGRWIAHTAQEPALRRLAHAVDLDRCIETAFELVTLRGSLERFVSPRLVATLAREKWLSLLVAPSV